MSALCQKLIFNSIVASRPSKSPGAAYTFPNAKRDPTAEWITLSPSEAGLARKKRSPVQCAGPILDKVQNNVGQTRRINVIELIAGANDWCTRFDQPP